MSFGLHEFGGHSRMILEAAPTPKLPEYAAMYGIQPSTVPPVGLSLHFAPWAGQSPSGHSQVSCNPFVSEMLKMVAWQQRDSRAAAMNLLRTIDPSALADRLYELAPGQSLPRASEVDDALTMAGLVRPVKAHGEEHVQLRAPAIGTLLT